MARPVDVIAGIIASYTYRFTSEAELQDEIYTVLRGEGYRAEREVRLFGGRDRIDLLVDGVGIECKVVGPGRRTTTWEGTVAQLTRYARSPLLSGLVLATSSAKHARMPDKIGTLPLVTVPLRSPSL